MLLELDKLPVPIALKLRELYRMSAVYLDLLCQLFRKHLIPSFLFLLRYYTVHFTFGFLG